MNTLCIYFFFYLFISGTIVFTILGVFAGSGNPLLLIENSLLDKNNKPKEESNLKKRVTLQYFIAAFLDLCFSLIFLKFIFNSNKLSKNIEINKESKKENIQNIKNEKQKEILSDINNNSINDDETKTDNNNKNNQGMSEKY